MGPSQDLHSTVWVLPAFPPQPLCLQLHHQSWSSCIAQQHMAPNATLLHCTTPDHLSIVTLSNFEAEEHPLRNLRQSAVDRLSSPVQIIGQTYTTDYVSRWRKNSTLPREHIRWRDCPRNYRKNQDRAPPASDHIYETIDDEVVEKYDPCSGWERKSSVRSNQNIISSLTAVLTGSPRPRHLPLLRDTYLRPQVAYSGIHSPTDSERSSSSLMDGRRVSSSTSPEITSSPGYEANDSQFLQSLPNLRSANGVNGEFSHVSKYPSDNTVLAGADDKD